MACIIKGREDGIVYFSTFKGWWVWVKPKGSQEDLRVVSTKVEDLPKLRAGKDMLFVLYPDGWIMPTRDTLMKFGWTRSAEGLHHRLEDIASGANTLPDFLWTPDRTLVSGGWKARLSPFLVKHPSIRGDECRYYGLALQFYPIWEQGEEGRFLTLPQPSDWDWVRSRRIEDVSIDDPLAFDGYRQWVLQGGKRGAESLSAQKQRKVKGSSRKKRQRSTSNRERPLGNLTRNKESISDSDERAKSRDLDSGRS